MGAAPTRILARRALLPGGWADDTLLVIRNGRITEVSPNSPRSSPADPTVDLIAGIVIPGICNAHSHAFQRALAGRTEQKGDSFWSWREHMYELAGRLDAGGLAAIARQAYVEMLRSGYTSVVEFHYLLREPKGAGGPGAMFRGLRRAAHDSGIRLTYVPVLYERSGFDGAAPEGAQRRFAMDVRDFLAHYDSAVGLASGRIEVGIGAHSLRAVGERSLREIAASDGPIHIHIAEQQREVEDCVTFHRRRPVAWLLERFEVNRRWCLVHATHLDPKECRDLAGSEAVVCLCPSTEANLGDGLFPLGNFLEHGGRIAIGSDSQATINPFEELRWLEYGQRARSRSRRPHAGPELFLRALAGGAQASGRREAGLDPGGPADLVVLDPEDPMLVGHDAATLLDALVFSGYRLPIERVMVEGVWRVIHGEHRASAEAAKEFAAAISRLGAGDGAECRS